MKKYLIILVCLSVLFTGCSSAGAGSKGIFGSGENVLVTDSKGHEVSVQQAPKKVVALSSSLAELWMQAGGQVAGTSSDAVKDREIGLSADKVTIVGTIKDPNAESIIAMQPDLVILSPDLQNHVKAAETLGKAGIPYYMAKVDSMEEYLKVLRDFVDITGEEECYKKNGEEVQKKVADIIKSVPASDGSAPKVLFLRAYSSGTKAIAKEHVVCDILEDIGVQNIAASNASILQDLSMEAIIKEDPDYILVVTMGDEQEAMAAFNGSIASKEAWKGLKAVEENKVAVLPKELFQYKPNNRWGDAYEYLLKTVYPEVEF